MNLIVLFYATVPLAYCDTIDSHSNDEQYLEFCIGVASKLLYQINKIPKSREYCLDVIFSSDSDCFPEDFQKSQIIHQHFE